MQVNYTLSWDRSDDDNERDPFTIRYAQITDLDAEWGPSLFDARHRFVASASWILPSWDALPSPVRSASS